MSLLCNIAGQTILCRSMSTSVACGVCSGSELFAEARDFTLETRRFCQCEADLDTAELGTLRHISSSSCMWV